MGLAKLYVPPLLKMVDKKVWPPRILSYTYMQLYKKLVDHFLVNLMSALGSPKNKKWIFTFHPTTKILEMGSSLYIFMVDIGKL